jgi:hypothetical protein
MLHKDQTSPPHAHEKRSAYQELLQKLATSKMTLRKIKNGQGSFPSKFLNESQNIPFLTHSDLQSEVKSYLKSGEIFVPKTSVLPGISTKRSKFEPSQSLASPISNLAIPDFK